MRPSFELIMLRKGLGSMERDRPLCSRCGRSPLIGEYLHRLESSDLLCGLCLSELPEVDRAPVSSERVRASERRPGGRASAGPRAA
jgi:ribosomal protein S27AE